MKQYKNNIAHWKVTISEIDKLWLDQLAESYFQSDKTEAGLRTALELAFKKGNYKSELLHCNTCDGVLGVDECQFPSNEKRYEFGSKDPLSICCENCQTQLRNRV
jgi:hypothetical protein